MSNDEAQHIMFTGERTGLEAIGVKGHGTVSIGDVIEVPAEQAARWTALLPMRDGKEGTDWVLTTKSGDEVAGHAPAKSKRGAVEPLEDVATPEPEAADEG